MDVRAWLAGLGLEAYGDAFAENDIDLELLPELGDQDLQAIGVRSLGHRKRMLTAIGELARGEPREVVASGSGPRPPGPRSATGETVAWRRTTADPRATVDAEQHLAATAHLERALVAALRDRGYVLVDRLGQGGMGEVYVARQASVGREVAVKVLRSPDAAADRARFEREARAIAAIDHPHAVRLFDYVIADEGSAAIVMEYVHGESLHALLARETRLPFERIGAILVQVCDALSEAHAKGIVHRDLKPGNVLLQEAHGYREFAKVLDFGLARWASPDESRLTRTGMVSGTPRYLSPEQVLGTEVGPRSDLYSLGVVLYEALAGRPPFTGELDASLLFKHVKEPAPALPSDVERPPELDRLLERLLAKSQAARLPSASALRRELSGMLTRARPDARTAGEPPSTPAATERRHVVAIHVALPFTRAAGLPDDAAHEALRARVAQIDAVARRHGGFVVTQGAREIEIVFGAPVARRDDDRRALAAALALRAVLGGDASGAPDARPSIGVAQGLAIAGALRRSRDAGYLVSGAPLERAAALAARAAPGEILVARDLAERTSSELEYGPARSDADHGPAQSDADHGPASSEASLASSLLRARETKSDAALPFVGRAPELDRLGGLLEGAARERTGRVVVIAGEAGIGKTRLVDQLSARARARGWRTARGLVFDVEVGRGEDALHRIVFDLLDLPEDASDRVAALERRLGPGALRTEQWPFLYHFLGIALPGAMQRLYDAMEESARREAYRDMLATLFEHETRGQPLLVLVEDVHWADAPTLDAIETFCELARRAPLALVLTSRVEGEERWSHVLAGHPLVRVDLAPLTDADALELAARLGLAQTARRAAVVARAAGHPLLLTELARAREDEVDDALPHTVQALVHARLDRLPEPDRAAIDAAAVIGPRFRVGILRDVLGDPDYVPTRLFDYRLLQRDADAELAFAHALVRDAVYESLVEERRRALHLRCAEKLGSDLVLRATHLDRAGAREAAAAYLEAARAELREHRTSPAQRLLARGLELARDAAQRIPLLEAKGATELVLGDASASVSTHGLMAELARDDVELYRAEIGSAAALRVASRYDEALAALDRAEHAAARAGIAAAQLHSLRGSVYFSRARLDDCREAHEKALAIARRTGEVALEAQALSGLADAHYAAARLASAAGTWERCVAIARAESLLAVEALNLPMLVIASVFLGHTRRAVDLAPDAIELARRLSHRRAEALSRGAASLAFCVAGEHDVALAEAERAIEITQALGSFVFEETGWYYAAQALLGLGRRDEALRAAERGLALCREHGMFFLGAALLALVARLEEDASRRRALLEEGAALVARGGLSFNRFWFYENAIEEALASRDAARARALASALEAASAEPIDWVRATTLRARALASAIDGEPGAARAAIEEALGVTRALGMGTAAADLEQALDAGAEDRPA